MATIEIDGKPYEAKLGQMIIEIADANGIDIPRFCYHKKLSIAANCRMCLVEVEKAPKPMPACATPIMEGMKIWTKSTKALAAQKAVMEFLLINHPLDCPICDQGGECELQDVAMGYGKDISRYHEGKRVVLDKYLGPLISTELTRCIHCTRCVRFGEEIAGIREFGATGRGEHTKIGTYIEKSVDFELSGNVIDLCPVGALTSKPFRFGARAWELQQRDSIAPHDSIGSNLHLHIQRQKVKRVVPKENESINEVWLSDRDRFSYEGLNAADRLTTPLIKQEGSWQAVDWETALTFAVDGLKKIPSSSVGALASPTATIEELYLLQKLMRGRGSPHIDHRLRQSDFSDQDKMPLFPWLGQAITDLEQCDTALVIGSHLRKEQPLLNHRLRKATQRHNAAVMLVNPVDYDFNMPIAQKIITPPAELVQTLAGVAKALQEIKSSPVNPLFADVAINATQRAVAEKLNIGKKISILLGSIALAHPQLSTIRALAGLLSELSGANFGYLPEAANTVGAWLAGVLPHRGVGGEAVKAPGLHAQAMLTQGLQAYVLLGLEPELDSYNGATALASLKKAKWVVSLTAYRTPILEEYATVMLPIGLFAETSGTYVNCEGLWQSFNGVVSPPGEARPAWKILRVLGNLFNSSGFDYTTSDQIRNELHQQIADKKPMNQGAWQLPSTLPSVNYQGLQRITEMPLYAGDALVRRAMALQLTQDMKMAVGVHINPTVATQVGVKTMEKVQVRQNETLITLPLMIDERVPDGCALIYAGQKANVSLGSWDGQLELRGL